MPLATQGVDVHTPQDVGPTLQFLVPAAQLNLASSVPASGSVSSNLIYTNGYKVLALGVTSSQAGTATIQRYLDAAGTIPQGPALSVSLTAATAAVLNATDGVAFQSAKVTVTNSGTVAATLSGVALLMQAD